MLLRLILAAVLIPLVELALLKQLNDQIGFWSTVVIILITGAIGATLARRQGRAVWLQIHQQLQQGRSPSREITDGVMILLAGVFLITPGLLTDAVGFVLLVPQIRRRVARWLTAWFLRRTAVQFQSGTWSQVTAETTVAGVSGNGAERPVVRVVDPGDATAPAGD